MILPRLVPSAAAHAPGQDIVFQLVDLVRVGRAQAGLETAEHVLVPETVCRRFQRTGDQRERWFLQQIGLFAQEDGHVVARHGHFERSRIAVAIASRDREVAPVRTGLTHHAANECGGVGALLEGRGRAHKVHALTVCRFGRCRSLQTHALEHSQIVRTGRSRAQVNDLGLLSVSRRHAGQQRDRLAARDKHVGFSAVGGDGHGQRQFFLQKTVDDAQFLRRERGEGVNIDGGSVQHRALRQRVGQSSEQITRVGHGLVAQAVVRRVQRAQIGQLTGEQVVALGAHLLRRTENGLGRLGAGFQLVDHAQHFAQQFGTVGQTGVNLHAGLHPACGLVQRQQTACRGQGGLCQTADLSEDAAG